MPTIDEAIRILKVIEEDCDRLNEPYSKEAIKLAFRYQRYLDEVARRDRGIRKESKGWKLQIWMIF